MLLLTKPSDAAYTPCKHTFDHNLEKFRQLIPAICTWIDRISKEKWNMTYDKEGRRYGHMTTNLSECVNKVLKDCRNLPITVLVKSTYNKALSGWCHSMTWKQISGSQTNYR